jgi:hypothetical protein
MMVHEDVMALNMNMSMPQYGQNIQWKGIEGTRIPQRLDQILCVKAGRALRNDFTVAYQGKLYQIGGSYSSFQRKGPGKA